MKNVAGFIAMAAPLMRVPMDFGRQHIGSRTHSNMTLNLKGGGEMKVSSLILSFNSRVIEQLISTLEITSLDVNDFEELAVRCFVDCVYSGGIDFMEMRLFRDVNKMAHIYEVKWLVERCEGYFTECLSKSVHPKFDEILLLVKNAWYAHEVLKKKSLWKLIMSISLPFLLPVYIPT